jgi:putative methylase
MIKRHTLEITLERLAKPEKPKPELEQYTTPADVAADMLWIALSNGDIQGRRVVDLGCGNGILGIGAALLGASSVHCYDVDPRMVELCKQNAAAAGVNVIADAEDALLVDGEFDTAIQNPPFGAQNPGADRPFIRTAVRIAKVAYSLHNAETIGFVMKFCEGLNADVLHIKNYKFKIPYMFEFHNKKAEFVYVSLIRIVPRR